MAETFGGQPSTMEASLKGAAIDAEMEKFETFEKIKDFLSDELGSGKVEQASPILESLVDQILYEEHLPKVHAQLEGILTKGQVNQYLHHLATYAFK